MSIIIRGRVNSGEAFIPPQLSQDGDDNHNGEASRPVGDALPLTISKDRIVLRLSVVVQINPKFLTCVINPASIFLCRVP
jgi:hypothetical protein